MNGRDLVEQGLREMGLDAFQREMVLNVAEAMVRVSDLITDRMVARLEREFAQPDGYSAPEEP